MACAFPTLLDDSTEKANGTKLARLLIDGGTWALRHVLDSKHPGASLITYLNSNKSTLQAQLFPPKGRRVLNIEQWRMLYPPPGCVPNTADFDITLLFVLLRNTCGFVAPPTGWNNLPAPGDNSLEAQLATIKWYKNKVYSHITTTGISNAKFGKYWTDISTALLSLGVSQNDIDHLKSAPLGEKEYVEVLKEWKDCDVEIADTLNVLQEKMEKHSSELAKHVSDELAKQSAKLEEIKTNIGNLRPDVVDIHINCTNSTTTSSEPVKNGDVLEAIMHDIVTRYNQAYSQDADKHAFIQYLLDLRLIHVKSQETQSLCITVQCPTLESLEALWKDYINGHLNEVAEKHLVMEDTLKKFDLSEVKLKTTISEGEYKNCLHFLNLAAARADHAYSEIKERLSGLLRSCWERRDDDEDVEADLHAVRQPGDCVMNQQQMEEVKRFFKAIQCCNAEEVQRIGQSGVFKAAEARDESGKSAMHFLAEVESGRVKELFDSLVSLGCHVDDQDEYGDSPLMLAAEHGNKKLVELLLEKDVDLERKDKHNEDTALHWAAKQDRWEIVHRLLNKGASANAQNKNHQTPLHLAVEQKHLRSVKLLRAYHADPNLIDQSKLSPKELARIKGYTDICGVLDGPQPPIPPLQVCDVVAASYGECTIPGIPLVPAQYIFHVNVQGNASAAIGPNAQYRRYDSADSQSDSPTAELTPGPSTETPGRRQQDTALP